MLLVALLVLLWLVATAGVVRCSPIRGNGSYYVDRTAAEERGSYLSAEGLGTWYGTGLARLGLTAGDAVAPEVFKRLLLGVGPGGAPLVQNAGRKRRAGTELNFSTSKSFDALYAVADDRERAALRALFARSVRAVLDRVQREHAWCRRGHDGHRREPCDLSFALFFHETNRAGEPFLHCHAVVVNVAVRRDGTTGGVDHAPLYAVQRLASVLFDLHLVAGLRREFGIEVVPSGFSYAVPGVPPSLLQFWSGRKRQIDARLRATGAAPTPAAAEDAARDTRPAKRDWHPAERRERWAAEAAAHGMDVDAVLRRGRPRPAPTPERDAARAAEAVREAGEALLFDGPGFTRTDLVVKAGVAALPLGIPVDTLLAAVDRVLARPAEHNLIAAGSRKGEPLFEYRDPPAGRTVDPVRPVEPSKPLPSPAPEASRPKPTPDPAWPAEPTPDPSRPGDRRVGGEDRRLAPADVRPIRSAWVREITTLQTLADRLVGDPVRGWRAVSAAATARRRAGALHGRRVDRRGDRARPRRSPRSGRRRRRLVRPVRAGARVRPGRGAGRGGRLDDPPARAGGASVPPRRRPAGPVPRPRRVPGGPRPRGRAAADGRGVARRGPARGHPPGHPARPDRLPGRGGPRRARPRTGRGVRRVGAAGPARRPDRGGGRGARPPGGPAGGECPRADPGEYGRPA